MAEVIGEIEKPLVAEFKGGRKLFFVPLIFRGRQSQDDYREKFNRYWDQVENQMSNLELKLSRVNKIYHELIPASSDEGLTAIKDLNDKSYQIVKSRLEKGAQLEATEDMELLTEFMDWNKCLAVGLQNQKVITKVYQYYDEANKKRNEYLSRRIDETLNPDEIGILFMAEGHQVQFPSDIQVFYVAPPALDEIKRWIRGRESGGEIDG